MKFYTTDNVELDYTDNGPKDGKTVMILTGIGGYKEIWQDTVEMLVRNGYRVINIDARNQGQSERTSKGLRISRHAEDLHEIQQSLKIEKPYLLGNSMGASTMFAYVSLFTDKDISGIIDVDQSPKMIADDTWKFGFKELTWENFPSYLTLPLGKSTYHGISDSLFKAIQSLKNDYPYDADLNYQLLLDHSFQDWRDIIVDLNVPLLVVAGKNSPFFDYHFAKEVASLSSKGRYEVIDDAGHIVMGEQPEKFNLILESFLANM